MMATMLRKLCSLWVALALCAGVLVGCDGNALGTAGTAGGFPATGAPERSVSSESIPAYDGEPYVVLDGGTPDFSDDERAVALGTEVYGDLDPLGRCTFAFALVGPETQTDEPRGSLRSIKPSGWVQNLDLPGLDHLYERSHLIAHRLTAENANERNLITGTTYLNQGAMQVWENQVAHYVDGTGGHVLMRVTPHFEGSELVPRGVRMEAYSLEDDGASVRFNVYCYNVQPGVTIDYATGRSWQDDADQGICDLPLASDGKANRGEGTAEEAQRFAPTGQEERTLRYVLNTRSKRFHLPTCSSTASMAEKNREDVEATRSELIAQGYVPCGTCEP